MRKRVLRYEFPIDDEDHVFRTGAGPILHVDQKDESHYISIWTEINGDEDLKARTFRVFGTGHPIDGPWSYVGTSVHHHTGLVWHVYEKLPGSVVV